MRHAYVSRTGAPRLILIFAGWGMDERPFAGLVRAGYDIAVVWDYTDMTFRHEWTEGYGEVCVLAWSMGVMAAQLCHAQLGPRVTARIAVAGTPRPVDDAAGIPEAIFRATLEGLSEQSVARFMRRMCGGAGAFAGFSSRAPQRSVESLRAELKAIGERAASCTCTGPRFDHCIVAARDAIFPPDNQRAAFEGMDTIESDIPHLPDFQKIIDGFFIDKTLVAERFSAARPSYDDHAEPQKLIADYLAGLLADKDTRAILDDARATVLEIGCGTGLLSRRVLDMHPAARLAYWDIAPYAPEGIDPAAYTACDAETHIAETAAGATDMIVSASTMQWFNSPERFVERALRALRPGGMLVLSTFGRRNMHETASASGVGLHLADAAVWREAIAAMPEAEPVEVRQVEMQCRFADAMHALRHLSRTGVNAITRTAANARAIASRLQPDPAAPCTLTYVPLFIIIRKKP